MNATRHAILFAGLWGLWTLCLLAPHRAALGQEAAAPPEVEAATEQPVEPAAETPEAAEPEEPKGWTGSTSFGAERLDGTQQTRQVSAKADISYEGKVASYRLQASTLYGTANRVTNQRRHEGQAKGDRLLTPSIYYYLLAGAEYDAFQDLDLRSRLGTGLGYKLSETDGFKLKFELGANGVRETFHRDVKPENDFVEGRAALLLSQEVNGNLRIKLDVELLPDVKDPGRFRVKGRGSVLLDINTSWAAELRLEWDHDQQPAPQIERNDTRYIMGLSYKF